MRRSGIRHFVRSWNGLLSVAAADLRALPLRTLEQPLQTAGSITITLQPCAVAGGQRFSKMRFVFVAEVFNRADDVGCGFSETAKSGGRYGVRSSSSSLDVAFFALAVNDALTSPASAWCLPGGGALAAAFPLGEAHEEPGGLHHAGILVHDDKAAGTASLRRLS